MSAYHCSRIYNGVVLLNPVSVDGIARHVHILVKRIIPETTLRINKSIIPQKMHGIRLIRSSQSGRIGPALPVTPS